MKIKYIMALSLAILLFRNNAAQDKILIRINDREIGRSEFESRLNNIPQTLKMPLDELKENLVCTLIAETILAEEAAKQNLDTLLRVKLLTDEFNDECLYEEWMNREIRNKVDVSEDEIRKAMPRIKENRYVEFWTTATLEEANLIQKELTDGKTPTQKSEVKKIEFSEALPQVEDAIYDLQDGRFSKPMLVDSTYYVFKLIKKEPVPELAKYSLNELKPEVEKLIRTRKENNFADERLGNLMKDKAFSINKEAYRFLLMQLYSTIYDDNQLKYDSPELLQQELFLSEVQPGNGFDQTLISFNDGSHWTVMDCWKALSVSPYPMNYKNPADLQTGLFDILKRIILLKSIAADAKQKKYDDSEYVKNSSKMWSGNVLAQANISRMRSSINITENDLINLYDSTKQNFIKPEIRKIIPLIVKDKALAYQLYDRIAKGDEIIDLAKEYSVNKMTLESAEPGVFITRNTWGKIGENAFMMHPGEISKPVVNDDSTYAVIKLLDVVNSAPYPFDEIKTKLSTMLVDIELQKLADEFISTHLEGYKIEINRAALKDIQYYGGNMGVKKTHFPLRPAVPSFPLFSSGSNWYKKIISNQTNK